MRGTASALVLVVLSLAVFGQTRDHDFLAYDDDVYVTENPLVREGDFASAAWRAFAAPYEANWIPLTWLSLRLDAAVFGLEPAAFHATNLALHTLAALLLLGALWRLTGALAPSLFAAAVFAVHPLHVESVAWIAERKDVLAGVGFAALLWSYARWVQQPDAWRYAALLASLAFGLLAKPALVTAPLVLLLLDVWPLRRVRWKGRWPVTPAALWLEKLPLLALAALSALTTWAAQSASKSMLHGEAFPPGVRLANAALALLAYLGDAFWPAGLAVFYPHPGAAVPLPAALGAAAVLVGLTAAALVTARRWPWLGVGWLWFVGMLVPVLGLVQVGIQARADRYTYLPLVGLALALAWSVHHAVRDAGPGARRLAACAGVVGVIALAVAAHQQVRHWRDTETLFLHAVRVTRDNFVAYQGAASEQLRRGALDEAERNFREALRIAPRWGEAWRGLADVHAERGDWEAAIRAYDRAVATAPRDALGHLRLARALAASGRISEAIGRARHAARLARGGTRAQAQLVLGTVLAQHGALGAAVEAYDAALESDPRLAEAHAMRGLARLAQGRPVDAVRDLEAARAAGLEAPELQRALEAARAAADALL